MTAEPLLDAKCLPAVPLVEVPIGVPSPARAGQSARETRRHGASRDRGSGQSGLAASRTEYSPSARESKTRNLQSVE